MHGDTHLPSTNELVCANDDERRVSRCELLREVLPLEGRTDAAVGPPELSTRDPFRDGRSEAGPSSDAATLPSTATSGGACNKQG